MNVVDTREGLKYSATVLPGSRAQCGSLLGGGQRKEVVLDSHTSREGGTDVLRQSLCYSVSGWVLQVLQ